MTSLNDVITSNVLLIWKALIKTFHLRYYTIWFLQFQNLTAGYTIFDPSTNYEGHQQSVLKINKLRDRLCATFTPNLKFIKLKLLEK
jgi:hypothetical protein